MGWKPMPQNGAESCAGHLVESLEDRRMLFRQTPESEMNSMTKPTNFAQCAARIVPAILVACTMFTHSRAYAQAAPELVDVRRPQLVREFFTKELNVPPESISAIALGPNAAPRLIAAGRLIHNDANKWELIKELTQVSAIIYPAASLSAAPIPHVLAATADGVWLVKEGHPEKEPDSPPHADALIAVPGPNIWAIVNTGPATGIWSRSPKWKRAFDLDSAAGKVRTLCQLSSGNILAVTEKGLFKILPNKKWEAIKPSQGRLPDSDISRLAPLGAQHAILLTPRGMTLTDGAHGWLSYTAKDGLPIESLTCASTAGDTTWFGSDTGAIQWRNGQFSYFAGLRWLPDDHINAIAAGQDQVWIATRAGLSHIFQRPMTLQDKADFYQHLTEARPRRLGFVTAIHTNSPGDFEHAEQEISDNDGLWTSMYVAAECFRYASTHSPQAREQARKSMLALLRLESITGIPGFPARSISNIDDPAHARRSTGQWHPSPVEKGWAWKGDTSSDEIVGHFLAFYLYSELVANDAEKQQIRATAKRIIDHILDHDYNLVDITGKPTTWGYWSPSRLNDSGRVGDRGLNSLEILSHLKVAIHLLGDERYKTAYRDLIENHHYALNTVRQRLSFNGYANHSDDELAMLSYYPLLMLETDPALKSIYIASLRRTWTALRPESCPLWNFIYGACAAEPCDAELAINALYDIPLDLIHWPTANARRADLKFDPANDRFNRKQLQSPLPWSERPLHKWNQNPYQLDDGDGREEEDPTFWLLPYWMGKHHHLIN